MKNISKKNAFRDKIRKNYINNYFEKKRRQFNDKADLPSSLNDKNISENQHQEGNHKNLSFIHDFQKQYLGLISELPLTIQKLVQKTNNYPDLSRTLLLQNLQKLTSTFPQTNLIQWSNYIYLIQSLLIFQPEHQPDRIQLIQKTSGPILYRVNKLCQDNKMSKISILRNYYDYLVAVGSDILFLDAIDIALIVDNIKKVIMHTITPDDLKPQTMQQSDFEDLFRSVIHLCNNIISLSPIRIEQNTFNREPNKIIKQYECEHTKLLFLNQFSKTTMIIKNLVIFAISADQIFGEQIIRFLINYTYILKQDQHLRKIKMSLFLLIQSLLAHHKSNSYEMNILLLRLINNIAVSGVQFCSDLVQDSIIYQMSKIFGAIYFKDQLQVQKIQYQISVQREFVSTLASCIIIAQEQPRLLQYFQYKCQIKKIILQTLRIAIDEPDLLIKSLQVVMIYLNLQPKYYAEQLQKQVQIFQSIHEKEMPQNINVFIEQILNTIEKASKFFDIQQQI